MPVLRLVGLCLLLLASGNCGGATPIGDTGTTANGGHTGGTGSTGGTGTNVPPMDTWLQLRADGIRLLYQEPDRAGAAGLLASAREARSDIAAFFGLVISAEFTIRVYPTRAAFDAYFHEVGVVPACWMIARALPQTIEVLAPRLWSAEQCGHAESELAAVLRHETVHLLHAQFITLSQMSYTPGLRWFVEGLAVHAAGQLTPQMQQAAANVAARSGGSLDLTTLGNDLYAVGGSLVAFLEARHGRAALVRAMAAGSAVQLLSGLGVSETGLLRDWIESVTP